MRPITLARQYEVRLAYYEQQMTKTQQELGNLQYDKWILENGVKSAEKQKEMYEELYHETENAISGFLSPYQQMEYEKYSRQHFQNIIIIPQPTPTNSDADPFGDPIRLLGPEPK